MSVRPARRGPARRGPALRAASRGPASRARQASRGGREGPAILGAGGRPGACHRGREPGQGRVPEESCGGWDPRPRARPAPDLHWPPGRRGGGCLPPPPLPPHPLPPAPPSSLLSVPTGVRNVGVLGKDNVRVKKMGLAAGRRGRRAGPGRPAKVGEPADCEAPWARAGAWGPGVLGSRAGSAGHPDHRRARGDLLRCGRRHESEWIPVCRNKTSPGYL